MDQIDSIIIIAVNTFKPTKQSITAYLLDKNGSTILKHMYFNCKSQFLMLEKNLKQGCLGDFFINFYALVCKKCML